MKRVLRTISVFLLFFFYSSTTNSEIGKALTRVLTNAHKHSENTFNTHLTKTHLCADAIHGGEVPPTTPPTPTPPICFSSRTRLSIFLPLFLHCSFIRRPLFLSPTPLALAFCFSWSLFAVGRQAGRQAGLTGPLTDKEEMVAL